MTGAASLPAIVLASASPRRAALLRSAGIDFEVLIADVDETPRPDEDATAYVRRLAEAKAREVVGRAGGRAVLGADTVVVVDGRILGKPGDAAEAGWMLRMLSGRGHEVVTGVSLIPADSAEQGSGTPRTRTSHTTVEFATLSDPVVEWYVSSGEPMDKAGGYAIQGLASRFVTRIEGSYSNVVGLPVALVYSLLTGSDEEFRDSSNGRRVQTP